MRSRLFFMLAVVFVFGLAAAGNCDAAIYKYVDDAGIINFADDLQSVPAQYRATAKIVSGEAVEKPAGPAPQGQPKTDAETVGQAVPHEAAPAADAGESEKSETPASPFIKRAVISLVVVVTVVFAFLMLGNFQAEHLKAVRAARIFILWGASVYLIYAHAGDLMRVIGAMGDKVDAVQQQSAEKGKKAAKAAKALNAVLEEAGRAPVDPGEAGAERKE
jgi:hypothetical protein